MHTREPFYLFMLLLVKFGPSFERQFRLGMLSPRKHPRLGWETNAAAVTIAIDRAYKDGLLKNHTIRVIWRNDNCSPLDGAGNTVLLRDEEDVDMFIGPPCSASTRSSGLLASYWNIPMFSQASTDPVLADKSLYKTLVRLGPPFNKLGKAFVEIFRHFHWSRVVMVSRLKTDQRQVFCDYSSRSAEEQFREANITLAEMIYINDNLKEKKIDEILSRIQQRGRIVILCTENTSDRRRILLRAYEKGMTDGEYVFFTPDHLPPSNVEQPWNSTWESDERLKLAYNSVFQITVAEMAGPIVEAFRDEVPQKMALPPWNFTDALTNNIRGSLYSPFLHDVVYLYLLVLNETLEEGLDPRNGTLIFHKATGKTFQGITGTVKVDSNGDRDPDYWVWDMNPGSDRFQVAMEVQMTSTFIEKMNFLTKIVWGTENKKVPLDTPQCGFEGEFCVLENEVLRFLKIFLPTMACLLFLCFVAGILYHRHFRLERELRQMLWKVHYDDIIFRTKSVTGDRRSSVLSLSSCASSVSSSRLSSNGLEAQIFSPIAIYKGSIVCVQPVHAKVLNITRADQLELKGMRDLINVNINNFAGICVDDRCHCFLTAYCSKGSIQDIVENDNIKLDWMFKYSLIRDITNGLQFIHDSALKVHGNLKSSNCLVDNRWVAKLTDFGMKHLRQNPIASQYEKCKGQFWTAPELLRLPNSSVTKSGDIYSLAIVMYEIAYRCYPYDTEKHSPQEIVSLLAGGAEGSNGLMRPDTGGFQYEPIPDGRIISLMQSCWDEIAAKRPTVTEVRDNLKRMNKGNQKDIVDNMLSLLEKYANNLEDIVEERTQQLMEEKKKTDRLLFRMLPPAVAEMLKVGQIVKPELYDSVTIFFSDIVGFTSMCSDSTPMEVVDVLNDLYTCFDAAISEHDVYKVETIGDAYMVVSGVPLRNGTHHVAAIANMALDLLSATTTFTLRHRPGFQMKLRAGVHTGPCAAGVVGQTMPRYCLFGDTVNTASRMESNGEALKIHVSETSFNVLKDMDGYVLIKRGTVSMKGKGLQTTYWLLGKKGYVKPLPVPEAEPLTDVTGY